MAKYFKTDSNAKNKPGGEIVKINFMRILLVAQFISILIGEALLGLTPAATTYEFSVYPVYSTIFWGIMLSIIIGQILLLVNNRDSKLSYIEIFNIAGLIIATTLLLLIPVFRGYVMYGRGDPMTHIGYIKDILNNGHISLNAPRPDIYPVLHILGATLKITSNILLLKETIYIPYLFYMTVFIPGFYLMAKYFLGFNKDIRHLFMLFSFLPLFGTFQVHMYPHMMSFFLIPLILYSVAKIPKSTIKFEVISGIFMAMLVYFHPITCVYLLVILSFLIISKRIVNAEANRKLIQASKQLLLIISVVWVSWYFSYKLIVKNLSLILLSILVGKENEAFQIYVSMLSRYSISMIEIVKVALYQYGTYFILGTGSFIWILKNLKKRDDKQSRLYFFALMFLIFGIWSIANMFIHFVNFYRVFKFLILFSTPIVAYSIYTIIKRHNRKIAVFGVILFIIILDYFAVFTLYPSFNSRTPNPQVSLTEYIGMNEFFTYRNEQLDVYDIGIYPMRFCHAINGIIDGTCYKGIKWYTQLSTPPPHFGYTSYGAKDQSDISVYLVYSSLGKNIYNILYPEYKEYWKYLPDDYHRLYCDFRVEIVYSNGNLIVHKINKVWW